MAGVLRLCTPRSRAAMLSSWPVSGIRKGPRGDSAIPLPRAVLAEQESLGRPTFTPRPNSPRSTSWPLGQPQHDTRLRSVLRLQNVYGPGQSLTNSYTGIVALFARLAREQRTLEVYEDGRIVRDFVYIDDVVEALFAAVARPTIWNHCHAARHL